jgi:hypothetical protein
VSDRSAEAAQKGGEKPVRLTPPKQTTFWISVILAVLGLLGKLVTLPVISMYSFWLVLIGFVLLALGSIMTGL